MSKVDFLEVAKGTYHRKHLGVLGCAKLIEKLKPRLAIISVWGEEYAGYRTTICRALHGALQTATVRSGFRCVPGDRGLELGASLDIQRELQLYCSHRRTNGDLCHLIAAPVDEVRVGTPQGEQVARVNDMMQGKFHADLLPCPPACKPHPLNIVFDQIERLRRTRRLADVKRWIALLQRLPKPIDLIL